MMFDQKALPKGAVENADGSVLLTLSKAVTLAGRNESGPNQVDVQELTFNDLTAGDLIDSGSRKNGSERTLYLVAASTGHTGPAGERILRALSVRDYMKATKIVDLFTNDGPETGEDA